MFDAMDRLKRSAVLVIACGLLGSGPAWSASDPPGSVGGVADDHLTDHQADAHDDTHREDLVAALREAAAGNRDAATIGAWSGAWDPGSAEESPLTVRTPSFELTPGFMSQFRYTVSAAPQAKGPNGDTEYGFGYRRLRPVLRAKALDGALRFFLQTEAASGEVQLLDAWASYDLSEHVRLRVGRYNLQFDRELITPAPYLLAVDRSALSNTLNVDAANRVEGLELRFQNDVHRLFLSFNEGLGVADTAFSDPTPNWGVTARYERMLIGDGFDPTNQFTAPRGTPKNLRFGAAVHTQQLNGLGDRFAATMDLTYRHDGFNALVIVGAQSTEDRNRPPFNEPEHDWGMVFKSGVYLTEKLEVFARSELATTSDDMHPELAIASAGLNYYFFGHALKFSSDFTVGFDGVGPAFDRRADGLIETPDGNNRYVFHAQIQMLF